MKEFNVTGSCIPNIHYMVDISSKIDEITKLVDSGKYFTINRARQYGKTTIINQLYHKLKDKYLVIDISFEGLGDKAFSSENEFCESFINLVSDELQFNSVDEEIISSWEEHKSILDKFEELSKKITYLVKSANKEVIIMIDEVDKSSNNQLFLDFLGMLRTKYLRKTSGKDQTFKSVMLAGVYDIKNLKLKLRAEDEKKYNSPWNIATNFTVDMTFNPKEISTMLIDYENGMKTGMDIQEISKLIYDYTKGYPFLVSGLCKIIDEEQNKQWIEETVEKAVKTMLVESNTLFDDLFKNLENDEVLCKIIFEILFNNEDILYSLDNPVINKANMFSIIREEQGKVVIHNKIFEIRIYNYFISKLQTGERKLPNYFVSNQFVDDYGDLKIEQILNKFQDLMKEEYRNTAEEFLEREGRLIFLAFIKPIINGIGFYFVESQTRDNQRLDIVITFNKKQYIIELKKWYGKDYEEKGYQQLVNYLEIKNEKEGYLVIFDFRKVKKEYKRTWVEEKGKRVYEVIV